MKKLFSILSVLICMVMLTSVAFAADADAYTVYLNSVKKLKSASSMELSVTAKASLAGDVQAVDVVKASASMKMLKPAGGKFQMTMKWDDPSTNKTSRIYFKDGYYYENDAGEKRRVKDEITMSEAVDTFLSSFDFKFTKDDLKNATVKVVDGDTKITVKKDSPLSNSFSKGIAGLAKDTLTITIGSDGMLKSCSYFASEPFDNGDSLKMKYTMTLKVKSVNSVEKIDFPSDLGTYKESK